MLILSALLMGLIFGIGLIMSGMSNPANVLAFLDVSGSWNPALIFVMAGAILVTTIGFQWAKQRGKTLLRGSLQVPTASQIDLPLIVGSLIFGVGWGIAGICPGPALVLLGQGEGWIFVLAMLGGMVLFELYQRQRR